MSTFKPVFLVLACLCLLLAVLIVQRRRTRSAKAALGELAALRELRLVALLVTVPPLLHHVLLLEFTAVHEFALLKDSFFICLLASIIVWVALRDRKLVSRPVVQPAVIAVVAVGAILSVLQYRHQQSATATPMFRHVGEQIAQMVGPNQMVFARVIGVSEEDCRNYFVKPQLIVYAHRNIEALSGTASTDDVVTAARTKLMSDNVPSGVIVTVDSSAVGPARAQERARVVERLSVTASGASVSIQAAR